MFVLGFVLALEQDDLEVVGIYSVIEYNFFHRGQHVGVGVSCRFQLHSQLEVAG